MKLLINLLYVIIVLATVAIGVLFSLQNSQLVPMDMLVYQFQPHSLALWVLSALALGGVLGIVTSWGIVLKLRASLRIARRQLQRSQQEVDALRTAGLKDGE